MSSTSSTMSQSTTEGLNQSTNVVLKLSLDEGDKTQLRRITLARLWDNDRVSYARLVDLALEYSSQKKLNDEEEEMKVVITYVDEDGDTIHISSDEELADAFGQFVDTKPPVLRVKGNVVQKTKAAPKTKAPEQNANQTRAAPTSQRDTRHSNSSESSSTKTPQVNVLFEAVRPIVLALQEKLAKEEADTKEKLKDLMQNAQKIVLESTDDNKDSSASSASTERTGSVAAAARETVMDVMENAKNIVLENEDAKSAPPQPQNESEAPFIHGRHTCDKCLCTPIIGTRYHATNAHDFDLCAKCFDTYKGDDIHFEPEISDRDRPIQMRWQRRQARRHRQSRFSGGEYPGQCQRFSHRRHRLFRSGNANNGKQDELGDSLKEAIRRSLADLRIEKKESENKEDEKQQASVTEDSEEDTQEAEREDIAETKDEENTEQEIEDVKEPKMEEDEPKAEENEPKKEEIIEKNEESEMVNLDTFETGVVTVEELNNAVNSDVVEDDEFVDQDVQEVSDDTAENDSVIVNASAKTEEDEEIHFVPDVLTPDLEIVSKESEQEVVITKEPEVDTKEQEIDIQGPEIVATAATPQGEENISNDVEKTQKDVASTETVASTELQQQSEIEVDDWDVVDEVDDIEEQIAGDEALARAASLLGSALFQSDLSDSLMGRQNTNSTQSK
uniref:ZZ-type domain-containing protein n=1 Tax=Ditylum brightwellii TaxID=49249 RepID=A0A7S2E5I4_9STRA|mmetsp:Transcript_14250/g.21385  ORF Transcript_14250/g.21385 Transcript_14250/m.21385 type:complete len:674 (+) Transcript_14250:111-2132(+)